MNSTKDKTDKDFPWIDEHDPRYGNDFITFKWGGIKDSRISDDYLRCKHCDKEAICEIIDNFTGVLWSDFFNRPMSKAEAKNYVMFYEDL